MIRCPEPILENGLLYMIPSPDIKIRNATIHELDWINQRYNEVEFAHSTFEREVIAIAEWSTQKAGIGRLVTIGENIFELGGMYVFEPFREKGIARKIVEFLLNHTATPSTIYCIPFQHLVPFYEHCGFRSCPDFSNVPEEILDKFDWCAKKYTTPTSLLILKKNQ